MRARPPSLRALSVLLGVTAVLPLSAAWGQEKVGVNAAVNNDANGTAPNGPTRQLVLGQDVVHNERIVTDAKGQTQILFVDGSSVSVGPNAELTIDDFLYDPNSGTGKMTLTAVEGAMRFVGGKLSKEDNAVALRTGTATIGVRGGVFVADVHKDGHTEVIFVYGKAVTVTGKNGAVQELYRPGFAIDIDANGGVGSPHPAPPGALGAILNQLDGRKGGSGGATNVPTNATVANSSLPSVISNNVQVSVQEANNNTSTTTTTTPAATLTVSPPQVPTNQIQTTSSQTQTVVTNPVPAPPTPPAPAPPAPPAPAPPAVSNTVAGATKFGVSGSNTGLVTQVGTGFSGATLSFPTTSLQNGTLSSNSLLTPLTGAFGSGTVTEVMSLSPLSAGTTTAATFGLSALTVNGVNLLTATGTFNGVTVNNGIVSINGVSVNLAQVLGSLATGTATTTADGDFFYANLFLNDASLLALDPGATGSPNTPIFIMGGTPVAPSFFTATSSAPQFYAFAIQPDFSLANGTQGQTIPFLPSFSGGTMANATVSPFLVVQNANTPFGAHNNVTNQTALGTQFLQASLAINGTGLNQSSALIVSTGGFPTSSDNGQVTIGGAIRGTVFTSASSTLTRISSSVTAVPDGNGNSLFGGNSIDGFVLDQNDDNLTNNFVPAQAASQLYQSGSGFTTTNFNFNQPAVATTLPTGIGAARSALNETGFFGGAMQCCAANTTTNAIVNYGLAGSVALQTDPATSRLAATFSANSPFFTTSPANQSSLTFSGLDSVTLQFGSLPAAGQNYGRSTFIDNSDFAALESPDTSSVVTRNINGTPTTTTVPTVTSAANSNFAPHLALVTSSVVPNDTLLAGGALCACQYAQWGFWTGYVQSPNSTGGFSAGTTSDNASINTWIAGQPTVTMPASGVGNYAGNAIGTVYNNGSQYLAAGGLVANFNFATNSGTLTISNFDGNTFSGTLQTVAAGTYASSLSGTNGTGFANGSFFGPNAVETGGNFGVATQSNGNYFASGVFDAASTGTSSTLPAFTSVVSGAYKSTDGTATSAGFSNQSSAGRVLYAGATIQYPAGSTLQNGAFSGTANGVTATLSPLTPGATTSVTGTLTGGAAATGVATMSADGDFFYANLASGSQREFLFGGVPVNQNFYANLPAQVSAFQLQPDAALASGSTAQTIPFLPSNFGGTMAGASVSDFYVTTGANSPFGLASSTNNYVAPKFLQASLVFNGQGTGQTSALVLATGSFFENTGTGGLVAAGGPVRGTVMLNATSSPVFIGSGVSTVPDANGNNLFGGNTLDGFVLDQNSYSFNSTTPLALQLASAAQFGQTTANFAFNQPATAAALPASAATPGQNLSETGYFGGLMTHSSNLSAPGNPYALLGTVALQATASNNRVQANFTGADPFTSAQSGINSLFLAFGAAPANSEGVNASHGTYINSNIYAATDSPITATTINGNAVALPPNSTTANPAPSIAMVTSGTVPTAINAILPSGVTPCSCQYLQWGYWTGQVSSTTTQGLGTARTDRAFINTWVAGQPTVTMPTTGTGTFNGAAVGTVFNNGASYVAAGGFHQTYNFGNNTGVVTLSNFDGSTYTAAVNGTGRTFSGSLTGVANRTGGVNGGFFGPGAVETGGNFGIQSTSGPRYIASGIFAGR